MVLKLSAVIIYLVLRVWHQNTPQVVALMTMLAEDGFQKSTQASDMAPAVISKDLSYIHESD